MLRLCVIFICLFGVLSIGHSQRCYLGVKTVDGTQELGFSHFHFQDILTIYEAYVLLNEDSIQILEHHENVFADRATLMNQSACGFRLFGDFDKDISGSIETFRVDALIADVSIYQIQLIQFRSYFRDFVFVILNDSYAYEFTGSQNYKNYQGNYYTFSDPEEYTISYVKEEDISGALEIITPPVYDTVLEQVLVKDSYVIFEEVPAEFVEDFFLMLREQSTCAEAIIDTVTQQVLVQDAHSKLIVGEVEFEEATECVLSRQDHGSHYYKREPIEIDTSILSYTYSITIDSLQEMCCEYDFISDLAFHIEVDSAQETIPLDVVYPPCRSGFKSAGVYCYSDQDEVTNEYEKRTYLKLASFNGFELQEVPAEYKTVTTTRISNANELMDSCIYITYDTLFYMKLAQDATSTIVETVPAEYETRSYLLSVEPAQFEVTPSEEPTQTWYSTNALPIQYNENKSFSGINNDTPCNHTNIRDAMRALALIDESVEINSKAYFQAIIDYQVEHRLNVGVIDETFIKHIGAE